MKKNLLALSGIALVLFVLISRINIQSVDEYYTAQTEGSAAYDTDNTESSTGDGAEESTETPETVTISIRCDTILENFDQLDAALRSEEFVPSDGVILPETEYALEDGDTVFDVLVRAVRDHEIQMEYQGGDENIFGSVYIQGIHYLYEYSCGPLSGWMYRVNGEIPDYGCSRYELSGGDVIEWLYTCDLGKDIGDDWMGGEQE